MITFDAKPSLCEPGRRPARCRHPRGGRRARTGRRCRSKGLCRECVASPCGCSRSSVKRAPPSVMRLRLLVPASLGEMSVPCGSSSLITTTALTSTRCGRLPQSLCPSWSVISAPTMPVVSDQQRSTNVYRMTLQVGSPYRHLFAPVFRSRLYLRNPSSAFGIELIPFSTWL